MWQTIVPISLLVAPSVAMAQEPAPTHPTSPAASVQANSQANVQPQSATHPQNPPAHASSPQPATTTPPADGHPATATPSQPVATPTPSQPVAPAQAQPAATPAPTKVQPATPTTSQPPATTHVAEPPQHHTTAEPKDHGDEAKEAKEAKWYDAISLGAFADAYAGINYNMPSPQATGNSIRAFDYANGFAFAWAGLDASYDNEVGGATLWLRAGPSAAIFSGNDAEGNMVALKQGYGTWKPRFAKGKLSFDLGKFNTLYGAEVAESQDNINYTRGALNWLGQPFFHTGLRMNIQATDAAGFTLMAVNGWNNTFDNNKAKSFGAQVSITPSDYFNLYLGYIGGPESDDLATIECPDGTVFQASDATCGADPMGVASTNTIGVSGANRAFRHFVDVIITSSPSEKVTILFNADLGLDKTLTDFTSGATQNSMWFGAMLGAQYAFNDHWAAALRGEYYLDFDGYTTGAVNLDGTAGDPKVATGTFTLDYAPASYLLLRLDNRLDASDYTLFQKGIDGASRYQFTTTFGVVVTPF